MQAKIKDDIINMNLIYKRGIKKDVEQGKKIVLFENFTLFHFDASLLGGEEKRDGRKKGTGTIERRTRAGGLFKIIKKGLRL